MKNPNAVDAVRVERLREAIRAGRFEVDPGRVADRLISLARLQRSPGSPAKRPSAPG